MAKAKTTEPPSSKPTKPKKKLSAASDADQVAAYMANVTHSLKSEMNLLRKIIKGVSPRIEERIKWNAPSYHCGDDIVTFGPIRNNRLLLVFHHPSIENIKSPLLEGEFKGRRLAYFASKKEITSNQKELERILTALLEQIEK